MGCVRCSSEYVVRQTASWFDASGYYDGCRAVTAWCVSHFRFLVGKPDPSSHSSHRMACPKDSDRRLLSVSSQCTCRLRPIHHLLLHQTCISQQSRSFVFRYLFIIVLLCLSLLDWTSWRCCMHRSSDIASVGKLKNLNGLS